MAKYQGWVIKKQYYKVEVEADSWEEARKQMWDFDANWAKPDDFDTEIYDVEEIENA